MIIVTPKAMKAIQKFREERNRQKPLCIHLQSTGCCDASLGLMADERREDDWAKKLRVYHL